MGSIPAFQGFPKEGREFFRDLMANNYRDWFEAHKSVYQQSVLVPAQAFTAALGERLKTLSPNLHYDAATNGSGSILRIYRDIRFSKDKTPYKTNLGIRFREGDDKKAETPGFFFNMDADVGVIYDGFYEFPKGYLAAYRAALTDPKRARALEKALETIRKTSGYSVGGDQLKRVPAGFDAHDPHADLLRYTTLYAQSPKIDEDELGSPHLVETAFDYCRTMLPLHQWLASVHPR